MKTVCMCSGSQRRDSHHQNLLKHLASMLKDHVQVDLVAPGEIELPLFNQDLENDPEVQSRVLAAHARLMRADAFVIASPEYNGMLTPYLKNLIDWVSRMQIIKAETANAFADKPTLVCAVSTGWSGGAVGVSSAKTLLSYVGCQVMGSAITVPQVAQFWTQQGFVFKENTQAEIVFHLQRLLNLLYPSH